MKTHILYLSISFYLASADFRIALTNDGPVVKGGAITFSAKVFDQTHLADDSDFRYIWTDDAIPRHSTENQNNLPYNTWGVTYDTSYPAGKYVTQVIVKRCVLSVICYEIGSARTEFDITEKINGHLRLAQKNQTREDKFVSNIDTVLHEVDIKKSDKGYINKAPVVLTYWFVDCIYYGITTDFKFAFNYTVPDKNHTVEALVMADFTPLPPSTTTTTTTVKPTTKTTTKPTTTATIKPTTTSTSKPKSSVTLTTEKPHTSAVILPKFLHNTSDDIRVLSKRSINHTMESPNMNSTSKILVNSSGILLPYNVSFPLVCNSSQIITGNMKTYGYFSRKIEVKAPLSKVNVTGNNWLQPGDLLSLKVSCTGSKTMQYCVEYRRGEYNVTGNETCITYLPLDTCDFIIKRYLSSPKNTILIIIKNEVSKKVTPVTVNIYKVNKQAQLSVIVVPVAFSLVAVVLIVFGIAYYFQNRSRFIVEVADFNFGQQYSDMEYKTFRERLKDSITNAFTRAPSPGSSEVPVWPPGRKYGSMT